MLVGRTDSWSGSLARGKKRAPPLICRSARPTCVVLGPRTAVREMLESTFYEAW